MIRILFVCYGNICRSPMAEFMFRDMLKKEGLADSFVFASAATSYEEIGNPVHRGTRERLAKEGISVKGKVAMHLEKEDYAKYDYIIGMEERNVRAILRIVGGDPDGKVCRLLDFSDRPRDIADPWYTGNFDVTYDDISEGLAAFLAYLKKRGDVR